MLLKNFYQKLFCYVAHFDKLEFQVDVDCLMQTRVTKGITLDFFFFFLATTNIWKKKKKKRKKAHCFKSRIFILGLILAKNLIIELNGLSVFQLMNNDSVNLLIKLLLFKYRFY